MNITACAAYGVVIFYCLYTCLYPISRYLKITSRRNIRTFCCQKKALGAYLWLCEGKKTTPVRLALQKRVLLDSHAKVTERSSDWIEGNQNNVVYSSFPRHSTSLIRTDLEMIKMDQKGQKHAKSFCCELWVRNDDVVQTYMTHMTYYWTPEHGLPHILTTLAHVFWKTFEQKEISGNQSISYLKRVHKASQTAQVHILSVIWEHAMCYNAPKSKPTHWNSWDKGLQACDKPMLWALSSHSHRSAASAAKSRRDDESKCFTRTWTLRR